MPDSPQRFRERFPALADTVYLASCSQGAASADLHAALAEFQQTMRDHGAPWDLWSREVERARASFARLIGARADEIAVVPCVSEAAYQVASTRDWSQRPRILASAMEFPSIAHVWLAQRPRGAEVVLLPSHDGLPVAEEFAAAVDERVRLVSVPLASYQNGARLPVTEITKMAHDAGAQVFVDAYQAAGVLPIDVHELGCDYLVSGALKYVLGVPGIAFLYVKAGLTDDIEPQLTGWFARGNPFAFDPCTLDYALTARRYEAGTPSIPSAYGAAAGLRTLSRADLGAVARHVGELAAELHDSLVHRGERVWSPADSGLRGALVALADDRPADLAEFLRQRRIITSPRGPVVRLALHYYNNHADVETLCAALASYRSHGF